jgi:superoxide dismutase
MANHFSRRDVLKLTGAGLSLVGAYGLWGFLDRQPIPEIAFDSEWEALTAASKREAPALAKWSALQQPRLAPVPLPFAQDSTPGISAATHALHYNHHYREYLWRWETGATRLQSFLNTGDQESAVREYQNFRPAATMAILHTLYWRNLSPGDETEPEKAEALGQWLASIFRNRDQQFTPEPRWLLVQQTAFGPQLVIVTTNDPCFRAEEPIVLALDLMSHAWRLDHASFEEALVAHLRLLPRKGLELLEFCRENTVKEWSAEQDQMAPWEARSFLESTHRVEEWEFVDAEGRGGLPRIVSLETL